MSKQFKDKADKLQSENKRFVDQTSEEFLKEPVTSLLVMAIRYLDANQQKSLANQLLDRLKPDQPTDNDKTE